MAKLPWILGNAKLQKTSGGTFGRVIGWGIPADYNFTDSDGVERNTCFGAKGCPGYCYAKQGTYNFPAVKAARLAALNASLTDTFTEDAIADIRRMRGVGVVRVHDSGDFYSQEYLNRWVTIALAFPNIIFYAYTKANTLDFTGLPSNFRITFSLGGKYDSHVDTDTMPHSRVFPTVEDMIAAGYVDGGSSDAPAITGLVKIGLPYHGHKTLTDSQVKYLRR